MEDNYLNNNLATNQNLRRIQQHFNLTSTLISVENELRYFVCTASKQNLKTSLLSIILTSFTSLFFIQFSNNFYHFYLKYKSTKMPFYQLGYLSKNTGIFKTLL